MNMRRAFVSGFLTALLLCCGGSAWADDAEANSEAVQKFVDGYSTPSFLIDKIPRWEQGICPIVAGLPAQFNAFVTKRLKQVAAQVGAPVQTDDACQSNIDVVFTLKPQELLDDIRAKHPTLLGLHDVTELSRVATVNYPIQAWYSTETEDQSGTKTVDGDFTKPAIGGVDITGGPNMIDCTTDKICFARPRTARELRNKFIKIADRLHSNLHHAVIVINTKIMDGHEIGPVADYLAMLALSATSAFDNCWDAVTIANLQATSCDTAKKPNAMTAIDIAYLRALYKMDPGHSSEQQRNEIADTISKELVRR